MALSKPKHYLIKSSLRNQIHVISTSKISSALFWIERCLFKSNFKLQNYCWPYFLCTKSYAQSMIHQSQSMIQYDFDEEEKNKRQLNIFHFIQIDFQRHSLIKCMAFSVYIYRHFISISFQFNRSERYHLWSSLHENLTSKVNIFYQTSIQMIRMNSYFLCWILYMQSKFLIKVFFESINKS